MFELVFVFLFWWDIRNGTLISVSHTPCFVLL
jgi:hypothetical protein